MKSFIHDLGKIQLMLQSHTPFAFTRFSDGEIYIINNTRLELNSDHYLIGNQKGYGLYPAEERKCFDPAIHQKQRDHLLEALKHKQHNYFKAISCPCCTPTLDDFFKQLKIAGCSANDEFLTWSNLFINNNYPMFLDYILPEFKKRKVVMVVNKSAKLEKLPFSVVKDFRVGENCFINDIGVIDEMKKFIVENYINDHVFLISAASLSNLIIYELYREFPTNTFIDIGSTLNPFMGMEGWKYTRDYLIEYFLGRPRNYLNKKCIWYNLILVDNEPQYWDTIYNLRFHPKNISGFVEQKKVTKEEHVKYMQRHGFKYKICLLNGVTPIGFIGNVYNDLRLAVDPMEHNRGVALFMLNEYKKLATDSMPLQAKVFKDNASSNAVFLKAGFIPLFGSDERFNYYGYNNEND